MTIKNREAVFVCERCSAEVEISQCVGWHVETQPSVSVCPKCWKRGQLTCDEGMVLSAGGHAVKVFDETYFMRGKEAGISLYENYRWLPELTLPMASRIAQHLNMRWTDTVLDFGCARGYTVKALRQMGYTTYGYDLSEWAVENADPEARPWVSLDREMVLEQVYDWVLAKDVLEHVLDLDETVTAITKSARKGVFAVVPLSDDGLTYVVPDYDRDVTHVHRLPLHAWVAVFARPGWVVECRYRLKGVKDNYSLFPRGNGFITCRQLDS